MSFDVGRVCVKLAGRDAGKKCVVLEVLGKGYVMIDGETRRRKCNVLHLEPTAQVLQLKKSASHEQVLQALGVEASEGKAKKAAARPRKQRKAKKA